MFISETSKICVLKSFLSFLMGSISHLSTLQYRRPLFEFTLNSAALSSHSHHRYLLIIYCYRLPKHLSTAGSASGTRHRDFFQNFDNVFLAYFLNIEKIPETFQLLQPVLFCYKSLPLPLFLQYAKDAATSRIQSEAPIASFDNR